MLNLKYTVRNIFKDRYWKKEVLGLCCLILFVVTLIFIKLVLVSHISGGIKNSKDRISTSQSQLQGIYIPATYDPNDSLNFERKLKLVENPLADGISLVVLWQDVEPTRGKYDFAGLDGAISKIAAKNKKVALRFLTGGVAAPEYITSDSTIVKISDNSVAPWDMVMLSDWARVVAEAGKHYAGKNWLQRVGITGPTMQVLEVVPSKLNSEELALWTSRGYTSEKLVAAWHFMIGEYNKAFPKDYLSIAFKPIVPSTTDPKHPTGDFDLAKQIAEDAYSQLGGRFVFQTSNFSDTYPRLGKSNTPADQVFYYMQQIKDRNPTGVLLGEQNMSIKYPEVGSQDAYRLAICRVRDLKIQYMETAGFRIKDKSLQDDFSALHDNILGKSEPGPCATVVSPPPPAKPVTK